MIANRRTRLIGSASLLFFAGCGPTPEQVLFYELELAVVSFGVVWLLMALGRLFYDSRVWFVCSYCLEPDARYDVRDGTMTTCTHCGRTTSVNELPRDLVPKVADVQTPRRLRLMARSRRARLLVTLLLAVAFQFALVLVGCLVFYVSRAGTWPGFDKHRLCHEVAFPFVFALGSSDDSFSPWWAFNWLLLISYHLGAALGGLLDVLHAPGVVMNAPGNIIAITLAQLALWSFFIVLGYRLRRRRWQIPALVAALNAVVAITAYIANWII